jgi:hypothetical protein
LNVLHAHIEYVKYDNFSLCCAYSYTYRTEMDCCHLVIFCKFPSQKKIISSWAQNIQKLEKNQTVSAYFLWQTYKKWCMGGDTTFTSSANNIWGRCYDHNFLRFSPIFGEKIGVFLKKLMLWSHFWKKLAVVWTKNAHIFAKFFGENIFKIITSVPDGRRYRTYLGTYVLDTGVDV